MALPSSLTRASRLIEFVRHMPLRKLARRAELNVRRSLADRLGRRSAVSLPNLSRSGAAPSPLFAPRRSMISTVGDRIIFNFLNRAVEMPAGAIDWNAPSPGPADQLWRMNLHYMEYLEDAATDIWQQVVAVWIADNPPAQPGAWRDSWNSYALSLRVVVLMQELQRRSGSLPQSLVEQVETSLAEQLLFLERNLETDLGGNHLIKNIKALIWASAYFTGPDAQRWRQLGLDLLDAELDRQVLPDGMHNERSASYHAQVFADLLECRHALGRETLAGGLDDALARMAQVTSDLAHPDGGPVLFNDAGLSMAYALEECLDVFFRLTGRLPKPRRVFALADAGYFGLRTGRHYFVADCGRIAPDDLPAHGHGDVLSFEWSVSGQRMIVDQGVFQYYAGERRQQARSAASHNTLCIEGADQAEFFGSFRCGRRPDVTVRHYEKHEDGFVLEGSHNGFRRFNGSPIHVRRFEAAPCYVQIVDRLEGTSRIGGRIRFLLHPNVTPKLEYGMAFLTCGDVRVRIRCSKPLTLENAMWWPDMGRELPTLRLVAHYEASDKVVETHLEI